MIIGTNDRVEGGSGLGQVSVPTPIGNLPYQGVAITGSFDGQTIGQWETAINNITGDYDAIKRYSIQQWNALLSQAGGPSFSSAQTYQIAANAFGYSTSTVTDQAIASTPVSQTTYLGAVASMLGVNAPTTSTYQYSNAMQDLPAGLPGWQASGSPAPTSASSSSNSIAGQPITVPGNPNPITPSTASPTFLQQLQSLFSGYPGGSPGGVQTTVETAASGTAPLAINGTPAATGAATASPSWFTDPTQEVISGVPNWGLLAAAGAAALLLMQQKKG